MLAIGMRSATGDSRDRPWTTQIGPAWLCVKICGFSVVTEVSLDSQHIIQLPKKHFKLFPFSGVRSLRCSRKTCIAGSSHSCKLMTDLHFCRAAELLGAKLCRCVFTSPLFQTFSHTVNLLGNLPLKCLDVLLTPKVRPGSLEYMGVNMDAVSILLDFLERRLDRVRQGLLLPSGAGHLSLSLEGPGGSPTLGLELALCRSDSFWESWGWWD